jgi:hypothetical protein
MTIHGIQVTKYSAEPDRTRTYRDAHGHTWSVTMGDYEGPVGRDITPDTHGLWTFHLTPGDWVSRMWANWEDLVDALDDSFFPWVVIDD